MGKRAEGRKKVRQGTLLTPSMPGCLVAACPPKVAPFYSDSTQVPLTLAGSGPGMLIAPCCCLPQDTPPSLLVSSKLSISMWHLFPAYVTSWLIQPPPSPIPVLPGFLILASAYLHQLRKFFWALPSVVVLQTTGLLNDFSVTPSPNFLQDLGTFHQDNFPPCVHICTSVTGFLISS